MSRFITHILLFSSLLSIVSSQSKSNSVFGLRNTIINSSYNAIEGKQNFLKGNANGIFGHNNFITGNANLIGDPMQNISNLNSSQISHSDGIIGDKNLVLGSYNALVGDSNIVKGNANGVFGNDNQIKGNGNLVSNFFTKNQQQNPLTHHFGQSNFKEIIPSPVIEIPTSNYHANHQIYINNTMTPPLNNPNININQFITKMPLLQLSPQKSIPKTEFYSFDSSSLNKYQQINSKNLLNMNFKNPFVVDSKPQNSNQFIRQATVGVKQQKQLSNMGCQNHIQQKINNFVNPAQNKVKNIQYNFQMQVPPINYQKIYTPQNKFVTGRNLFAQKYQMNDEKNYKVSDLSTNTHKNLIQIIFNFTISGDSNILTNQIINIFKTDLIQIDILIPQKILEKLRNFVIILKDHQHCKSKREEFKITSKSIQINCISLYVKLREKNPSILLQLFARAYYQFILSSQNSRCLSKISQAYRNALFLGKYRAVYNLYHNKVISPALDSEMQYFTIMTEAFFSTSIFRGQIYPFTNFEFKKFDFLGYVSIAYCWKIKNLENLPNIIGQPANYHGLNYRMI